jgi:hypothetical protein
MEIPARSFIPKTTRNRWAWGFAWASLAVFLFWNLMPEYYYDFSEKVWVKKGVFMIEFWPNIIGGLSISWKSYLDFETGLIIILYLALIFLALIQFLLAPLWRLISASRLLRFIPSGLCLIGCLISMFFICDYHIPVGEGRHFVLLSLTLFSLNFFLCTLALLIYHPEPEPIPAS